MKSLPQYLSLENSPDIIEAITREFDLKPASVARAKRLQKKGLPPLVKKGVLPYLFGVSDGLFENIGRIERNNYRVFKIKKASGGNRIIEAPKSYLKLVQRWIYENILAKTILPNYITGFVTGRSIFDNAEIHIRSKNILIVDIEDFFTSVNDRQVFDIFRGLGFTVKVSYQLANICTYKKRLPQGAPTSPMLANMAFLNMDRRMHDLAKSWKCVYSRYADDIAFSGEKNFSKDNILEIRRLLENSNFVINEKKSRIIGSGGRQMLTGLVVNKVGKPSRKKRMFWRSKFHHVAELPGEYIDKVDELRGIAAYVNMFDKHLAENYFKVIRDVERIRSG